MSSFRSRIRGRKPSSGSGKANGDLNNSSSCTGESSANTSIDTSKDASSRVSIDGNVGLDSPMPGVMNHPEEEAEDEELEQKELKDRVILNDPKYKSNRIEKSSSRSRIVPLTSRKISAPPVMEVHGKGHSTTALNTSVPQKKNARSHSHLNLNSLLKYKSLLYAGSSPEKKLTTEDFEKMRKKSMSEVAKAAQPNSDTTNSVQLIRHEFIDEVDNGERKVGPAISGSGGVSVKMSLSDKVAAKLSESKKKRSKSKVRSRRGSRRSSCNNSAVNIPIVLNKYLQEAQSDDGLEDGGEENDKHCMGKLGGWHCPRDLLFAC